MEGLLQYESDNTSCEEDDTNIRSKTAATNIKKGVADDSATRVPSVAVVGAPFARDEKSSKTISASPSPQRQNDPGLIFGCSTTTTKRVERRRKRSCGHKEDAAENASSDDDDDTTMRRRRQQTLDRVHNTTTSTVLSPTDTTTRTTTSVPTASTNNNNGSSTVTCATKKKIIPGRWAVHCSVTVPQLQQSHQQRKRKRNTAIHRQIQRIYQTLVVSLGYTGQVFMDRPSDDNNDHRQTNKRIVSGQQQQERHGNLQEHSPWHISLTRSGIALQEANIEPFIQALTVRIRAAQIQPFHVPPVFQSCILDDNDGTADILDLDWDILPSNENPTAASFLILRLTSPYTMIRSLQRLVQCCNDTLHIYNQLPYYDPPIFHISMARLEPGLSLEQIVTWKQHHQTTITQSCNDRKTTSHETNESESSSSDDDDVTKYLITSVNCSFGTTKMYRIPLGL